MEQLEKVGKWLTGKETHRGKDVGKNYMYFLRGEKEKDPKTFNACSRNGRFATPCSNLQLAVFF